MLLAVFGIFVGGLMTWHHDTQLYGAAEQQGDLIGCTESAEVNFDIVNTSACSELAGVPIATLAIPFYGVVLLTAGHADVRDGGHFSVRIVGAAFAGKRPLEQIDARTPEG